MKKYLKSLNWSIFLIIVVMSLGGTATNKSVHSFEHWLIQSLGMIIVFGIPSAIIFKDQA